MSPINFSDAADITEYENGLESLRLIPKTGVNTPVCEWPPGGSDTKASPMYRTLSLDVGVMVAGTGTTFPFSYLQFLLLCF
jgi:hypothetical protein